jgi:hypothetical protein
MTTRQEDESGGRNGGVLEMLGAGGVPQWSVWKGSHLAGLGESFPLDLLKHMIKTSTSMEEV